MAADISASYRRVLREATFKEHEMLDTAMSKLDLSSAAHYRAFLTIHRHSMERLRNTWRHADDADFQAMIECTQSDLAKMNGAAIAEPPVPREFLVSNNSSGGWGVSYVVRGSRLGAKVLRQRVPSTFCTSFLDYVPSLPWRVFVTELDEFAAGTEPETAFAIAHEAKRAFDIFADITSRIISHA